MNDINAKNNHAHVSIVLGNKIKQLCRGCKQSNGLSSRSLNNHLIKGSALIEIFFDDNTTATQPKFLTGIVMLFFFLESMKFTTLAKFS